MQYNDAASDVKCSNCVMLGCLRGGEGEWGAHVLCYYRQTFIVFCLGGGGGGGPHILCFYRQTFIAF